MKDVGQKDMGHKTISQEDKKKVLKMYSLFVKPELGGHTKIYKKFIFYLHTISKRILAINTEVFFVPQVPQG